MAGSIGGILVATFAGNILAFWETKGSIQTGYFVMFMIASVAYLIAWTLFNILAPRMKKVDI
jgi:MFS transporter, ACS family, hexuronate transporter